MNTDIAEEIKLDLVVPDKGIREAITKDAPDFLEIILKRKKLLKKVEAFEAVESVDDTPRMEEAKRLRLDLVKCRTGLENVRKTVQAEARRVVDGVNEMFRGYREENESAEEWLKESEEFAVRYEASRKAEVRQERVGAWRTAQLPEHMLVGVDPGEISTPQWDALVAGALQEKRRLEEASKVEQEERQRLRAENDRLQKEQHAERQKAAEAQREADAKLAEERRQREALEQQEKDRQHKIWQEEEAKKKEVAKAKRAPDKTKLVQFGDKFREWLLANLPECKSEEAKQVLGWIQVEGAKFVSLIKQKAENL